MLGRCVFRICISVLMPFSSGAAEVRFADLQFSLHAVQVRFPKSGVSFQITQVIFQMTGQCLDLTVDRLYSSVFDLCRSLLGSI